MFAGACGSKLKIVYCIYASIVSKFYKYTIQLDLFGLIKENVYITDSLNLFDCTSIREITISRQIAISYDCSHRPEMLHLEAQFPK